MQREPGLILVEAPAMLKSANGLSTLALPGTKSLRTGGLQRAECVGYPRLPFLTNPRLFRKRWREGKSCSPEHESRQQHTKTKSRFFTQKNHLNLHKKCENPGSDLNGSLH